MLFVFIFLCKEEKKQDYKVFLLSLQGERSREVQASSLIKLRALNSIKRFNISSYDKLAQRILWFNSVQCCNVKYLRVVQHFDN